MILNYKDFKESLLLENIINESYVYYSPNVKDILDKLKGNEIADNLRNIENTFIKQDITFIDLNDKGNLTFITSKNAIKLIDKNYKLSNKEDIIKCINDGDEDISFYFYDLYQRKSGNDPGIFTDSRNDIKIGKFVNRLFPGKFTSSQVEEFVNLFKANINKMEIVFELVEGDEINKWYYYENYKDKKGTLGKSCMSDKRGIFNLYVKNPDVCKLLILKQDDKILGRALVWKLNSIELYNTDIKEVDIEWFMDRQYTINDYDVIKFRKYAEDKGWCFKSRNTHTNLQQIKLTEDGPELLANMTVKVDPTSYDSYPYLDTFKRYDPHTGILYNDCNEDNYGNYILDDTLGGYTILDENTTVWSNWHGCEIDEEDSIYSEPMDDFIYADSSIYVNIGSGCNIGYWPYDHDDIKKLGDGNYCHVDDCVYSYIYDAYIYHEYAIGVVSYIHKDGDVDSFNYEDYVDYHNDDHVVFKNLISNLWFSVLTEKFDNWDDYSCVMKDILIKNYKNLWIPKILKIDVYRIDRQLNIFKPKEIIKGMPDYLSELDAISIGYEIDLNNSIIMDKIEYTNSILEIEEIILENLIKMRDDVDKYQDIAKNIDDINDRINEIENKMFR